MTSNETNTSMLVDIWASNSFMTPMCAERLKVEVVDTALPLKVNFAQWLCQTVQVAKDVRFKSGRAKFEEDFIICGLEGVNVVLGNTFLHYYGVEVRQRPNVHVVMVGSDEKPKPLPFTKLAGLDRLGINLVIKQNISNEQFAVILKKISIIIQSVCSRDFVAQLVSPVYLMSLRSF